MLISVFYCDQMKCFESLSRAYHNANQCWHQCNIQHYLTLCTFSFAKKESSACLIHVVQYKTLYRHNVVIKQWYNVSLNFLYRATFSCRHNTVTREKTFQSQECIHCHTFMEWWCNYYADIHCWRTNENLCNKLNS